MKALKRDIRLLPIVVMATSALLLLKTIGLVTGDGYTLSGVSSAAGQAAQVQEAPADPAADQEDLASTTADAADAAADALFEGTSGAAGESAADSEPGQGAGTESVVLERLSERRTELDAREQEIEERMALVEAAEKRVDERMADLEALEGRINALMDAEEAKRDAQFTALVEMYGSMRPRDAAGIFNQLDMAILTRVARAMEPRTVGQIMAQMEPDRAQALTVSLAQSESPLDSATPGQDVSDLPQIVGQ